MYNKYLIKIKNAILIVPLFYSGTMLCMQNQAQQQAQIQQEPDGDNELADDNEDIVFKLDDQETLQTPQEEITNQAEMISAEENTSQTDQNTEELSMEATKAERLAALKNIIQNVRKLQVCHVCGREDCKIYPPYYV
jgi:hypothetical protein